MPGDAPTSTRDAAVRARRHRRTCARRGLRIACVVVVGVLTVGVSQRLVNHDYDDGSGVADGERAGIGGDRGRGLRVGGVTGGSVGPSGDAVRERVVVDDHDDADDITLSSSISVVVGITRARRCVCRVASLSFRMEKYTWENQRVITREKGRDSPLTPKRLGQTTALFDDAGSVVPRASQRRTHERTRDRLRRFFVRGRFWSVGRSFARERA